MEQRKLIAQAWTRASYDKGRWTQYEDSSNDILRLRGQRVEATPGHVHCNPEAAKYGGRQHHLYLEKLRGSLGVPEATRKQCQSEWSA